MIGIIHFILGVIQFLVVVASWILLVYVIMALIIPQNKYTLLIGRYVEPILAPIRKFLFRVFPKLGQIGIDFSPLVFYFVIQIVLWLVRYLRTLL